MAEIIKENKPLSAKSIGTLKRVRDLIDSLIAQAEGEEVSKAVDLGSGLVIEEHISIEED